MGFKGKRIIITGAAGCLGKALVKRLHSEDAIVIALDKEELQLNELKKEFSSIVTIAVNLLDWDLTRDKVKAIVDEKPVDCLINNAGIVMPESFLETRPENIDLSFGIHYKAVFNISQVVAKSWIDGKIAGSIVNISSITSLRASENLGVYCSSKASLDMLTKVTAVACVFHAAKVEEHILSISRVLELARINATSLPWVKIPEELSFDKKDWVALWKNEVSETEFLVFTTVNPMRFLFINVYGFILLYLRKWVGVAIKEEEAVRIRDRAFTIASDVYSCGCPLIVTEPSRMVATMCLMMVLKNYNITITNWIGKTKSQLYWYHAGDTSTTLEKLKKMEKEFLAQLKQYNIVKTMDDKNKIKGVSPSSDYGSEGSVTSNPVSPSDSMCSDRDAMSNEPTSPAVSTASSSDHGLAYEGREHMKRPVVVKKIDLAPPCQLSLSVRRDHPASSSASSLSVFRQGRKLDMPMITPIEPVQKKMKINSPIRYP